MKIDNQKVATLIYDMYVVEEDGKEEVSERATLDQPLIYCHGEGMMLPAFEAAMLGKEVDETFDFVITPDQAYGDYDEQGVMTLDKKLFYNGDEEFDSERVYEGAIVPMTTTDNQIINAQVIEITDKGATIRLDEGVEGFCPTRHLQKEDKSPVAVGDELDVKILEFNRDAKRILVSHLRTWEERKEAPAKEAKAEKKEAAPELPKVEKTTLGDIDVLANLKASMEAEAKPAKKAPAKKAAKKEAE